MSKPAYSREVQQVRAAHPELDSATAQRVAETCVEVARESGTPVSQVLAETVRAENSSGAGNTVSP